MPEPCTLARGCDCAQAHVAAEGGQAHRAIAEDSEWDGEAAHAISYVVGEIDDMLRDPERYPNGLENVQWALRRLWAVAYEKGRQT